MRRRVILGIKQSSGGKCCLDPQREDEYRSWFMAPTNLVEGILSYAGN